MFENTLSKEFPQMKEQKKKKQGHKEKAQKDKAKEDGSIVCRFI